MVINKHPSHHVEFVTLQTPRPQKDEFVTHSESVEFVKVEFVTSEDPPRPQKDEFATQFDMEVVKLQFVTSEDPAQWTAKVRYKLIHKIQKTS